MKQKDLVKFKEPTSADEESALMVVIEMRGERVLVSDLRFASWKTKPTNVYLISDLEVVETRNLQNADFI